MMDLRCRCVGAMLDDRCLRNADEEDGLCELCRLEDGTCCEDYHGEYTKLLEVKARRDAKIQEG